MIYAFENFSIDRYWFEEHNEILMFDFVWPNETVNVAVITQCCFETECTEKRANELFK